MPGPVFQGRCIVEVAVPQKTVCQNECERCGRPWFTDTEKPTPKAIVRMLDADGAVVINASYDVICDGCVQTVANLLKALARDMKKLGSSKPRVRAKKEGGSTPSPKPEPGPTLAVVPDGISAVATHRLPPSGPSKRP